MPTIRTTTAVRNAPLTQIINDIGVSGFLDLYTGTIPGTLGGSSGTLVVSMPLSATAGAITPAGTLAFNAITTTNATGVGPVGWGRFRSAAGTAIVDLDAGVTGSGAYITMPSLSVAIGQPVTAPSVRQITINGG